MRWNADGSQQATVQRLAMTRYRIISAATSRCGASVVLPLPQLITRTDALRAISDPLITG